jgi:hypothetical protein
VAAEKGGESSTVSKGKRKAAPTRAKVYAVVDGPVSRQAKSTSICANMSAYSLTQKTQLTCITNKYERRCKKCQTNKSRCSWRGKSREVIEGEVTITSKRSKGELVSQADELSSEDKVQVVEAPRGEFLTVIPRFATHRTKRNS